MIDKSKLPNWIGVWERKSPTSNAWINKSIIALVNDDNVHFGIAKPAGASIKKVFCFSNEDVIKAIKSFSLKKPE